jgi:hypothetical protein
VLSQEYQHREEVGTEVRYNHEECNDSRGRLYVRRTPYGYYYFCHNCGYKGRSRSDELTPQETIKAVERLQENQVVAPNEIKLPDDFITDIPDRGLAWLYKYGITDGEIGRFGFGFSRTLNRLILPVFRDQDLIYWQGRALDPEQKPKYINIRAGGKGVFFQSDFLTSSICSGMLAGGRVGREDHLVCIVEDILSAIKVGRVTNAIALLGSYIPDSLSRILDSYDRVFVWLDSDKRKEAIKYSQRIQVLTGKQTKVIYTEKDPKEYTDNEIRQVLFST